MPLRRILFKVDNLCFEKKKLPIENLRMEERLKAVCYSRNIYEQKAYPMHICLLETHSVVFFLHVKIAIKMPTKFIVYAKCSRVCVCARTHD